MEKNSETSDTRILLVRHGETEWNRTGKFQGRSNIPLNQNGKNQANALALRLKDESLSVIYASPLARAIETARLIKVYHPSATLIEEDGFMEMDLGDFEGMDGKKWAAEHPDFLKSWWKSPGTVKMPGGESFKEVQARAVNTLSRILQLHPSESTVLICSHNFVILSLLCFAMDISLDKFRELRLETGTLSILYKKGEKMWMEEMNIRPQM